MSSSESHRIYWQQWLSSDDKRTRRDLITSSAAVRMSPSGATAADVTRLLRQSLTISGAPVDGEDSLVLVGTLYSLPGDYVKFEHEPQTPAPKSPSSALSTTPLPAAYAPARSDPFHVVRTLRGDENPLDVRDQMKEHLRNLQQRAPKSRTIISPKLQWYFVPSVSSEAATTGNSIPNCIDLDGYSTAMEEEEIADDDEEEDECEHDLIEPEEKLVAQFQWLADEDGENAVRRSADSDLYQDRIRREAHRYEQLTEMASANDQGCMSGYLLKRSEYDPHVWRRVHCVVTADYLWFVSRVYDRGTCRYAKHGRIRLTQALLLEPTSDYAPLFRTPFSFEIVSAKGTSHVFRATSKMLQIQWLKVLSERIVQSYENSLLEHAELLAADESIARNRRLAAVAVGPLWDACVRQSATTQPLTGHVGSVLRWGMEVADYREICRYIQSKLPAKNPVVVASPLRRSASTGTAPNESPVSTDPIEPALRAMIRATWEQATALLTRATHVALQMQPKLSRSLETLCRHVDYVLTGRFRSLTDSGEFSSTGDQNHHQNGAVDRSGPPPADLFDHLLAELQVYATGGAPFEYKEAADEPEE